MAALGACGLILIAAVGTQIARAASGSNATWTRPAATTAPPAAATTALGSTASAAAPADSSTAAGTPTVGTLRIHAPAVPGHVWVDGEKINDASSAVACGKHEVRVGPKGRAHTVDVPCGGEVRVTH